MEISNQCTLGEINQMQREKIETKYMETRLINF